VSKLRLHFCLEFHKYKQTLEKRCLPKVLSCRGKT